METTYTGASYYHAPITYLFKMLLSKITHPPQLTTLSHPSITSHRPDRNPWANKTCPQAAILCILYPLIIILITSSLHEIANGSTKTWLIVKNVLYVIGSVVCAWGYARYYVGRGHISIEGYSNRFMLSIKSLTYYNTIKCKSNLRFSVKNCYFK